MLYFLLFNIAPTLVELVAVLVIFWSKFSLGLAGATALMVVVYIAFTRKVTDWRNALRTRMNDLDTLTVGRSVDSLLNYETVKYFGAEEREAARYRDVADQRSEEHTSELQALMRTSYAVLCLKKKQTIR